MGLTGPVQANDIVMRASEIGTTIPGIASLAMKSARKGAQRGVQGIYQLPSGNEPTPEFMNVSQQNLNNQTRQMADMLNMLAPKDEQLAYINEEEAGILKLLGGSGTTENNPAGIPSFFGHGGAMHGDGGTSSGSTGTGGMSPGRGPGGGMIGGATPGDDGNAEGGTSEGFGPDTGGGNDAGGGEPDRDYRESVEEAAETEATEEGMQNIEDAAAKAEAMEKATVRDKYGNPVTSTNPETGVKTNVISRTQFNKAMQDYDDQKTRERYAQDLVDAMSVNPMARQMRSMDPDYGYVDAGDVSSETLGSMSAQGTLDNMGDRLGELTAKAKANTITTTELNELAQLNEFYGNNPTTGMGLVESLKYQFTNPDFKADLAKAAPVLGALALTTLAPASLKSIMSLTRMMTSFSKKPTKSLRSTIESALAKLGVKEREALAGNLPSTYRGFGIQGRGEGSGGGADQREEARRDTEEEEDTRERDRFERAFANRYFIGPASLDEVRKYAITGGGYNQLTPFYGREKETV